MEASTLGFLAFALLSGFLGYLLGSASFAIIITRIFFDTDIREKGSGNAGMTNVLRTFGKKGAAFTLLGDVGKGILATWAGRLLFMFFFKEADPIFGAYIAGVCAVIGHMFPVYFKFKGGKGVSVAGGVILAIQPLLALPLLLVLLLVVAVSGMVSLGSVLAISLYPVAVFFYSRYIQWPVAFCTVCAAVISGLVIFMHRSNIKRILDGTEYRFGKRFKKEGGQDEPASGAQKAEEEKNL